MKSVSTRKERKLEDRLTNEILDCFLGKGSTIAKKTKFIRTNISK